MIRLDKFEQNLQNSTGSQRKIIYLLPSLIVGFLIMIFIYPDTTKNIKYQEQRTMEIQTKIDNNSIALLTNQLKKTEEESKIAQTQIIDIQQNNIRIEEKLKELKFAFYDDLGFANNVKSILKESKDLNITIFYLKTKEAVKAKKQNNANTRAINQAQPQKDNDGFVKLIKQIELNGIGQFANIVKFIQFIEAINTLHDFAAIKIDIDKEFKIHFNLLINQYGVKLNEVY